ncbi:MAG: hypothetical protein ACREBC_39110 [Pyrinomonadaceae bacterium]
MTEKGPRDVSGEPLHQIPLLPELAAFLREQEVACLMQATNQGTAFVIKLPGQEIASVRGRVPIHLRHELYSHPAAPVIRTVLTIYDQPARPLGLETFTNAAQPDQRDDFARLASQDQLPLLFYDERLAHRLSKVVPYQDEGQVGEILMQAESILAAIPRERFSFERAKLAVMRKSSW